MSKILIVEDDEKLSKELKIFLDKNGYDAVILQKFDNAVEDILEENADLILLDINLPYTDGEYICKEIRKTSDVLFLTFYGYRMSQFTINKIVKRAYRKAELDENVYTVHTLRHTCATLLYRSGVNIKTIQELLGHVHIDTTEIYTHLDNQEVKDVMFEHPLAQFKMEDALAYCA